MRKRMARSRWPLPCFAAVRRGLFFDFGEAAMAMWGWARREGRERSVEEELKAWENQPVRRVGRSDMRDGAGEEAEMGGWESEMVLRGRGGRVRGRGWSGGSTMMGGSLKESSRAGSSWVDMDDGQWGLLREGGWGTAATQSWAGEPELALALARATTPSDEEVG